MIKISKYIKDKGVETILNACDNNLENVRQHLIRECNLARGYDLSRSLKLFEDFMKNCRNHSIRHELLEELSKKLKEN